jgi:hypothetical protein
MGGVLWFPTTTKLLERPTDSDSSAAESSTAECLGPILWRAPFESPVAQNLVSFSNPQGTVTNSDLELATAYVQHVIAAQAFNIHERSTIASSSNNTPTVAWQTKKSTTTTSAPAYLLRLQVVHQHFHQYY